MSISPLIIAFRNSSVGLKSVLAIGIITTAPNNPPKNTKLAMAGPTIYPTPRSAGENSAPK